MKLFSDALIFLLLQVPLIMMYGIMVVASGICGVIAGLCSMAYLRLSKYRVKCAGIIE